MDLLQQDFQIVGDKGFFKPEEKDAGFFETLRATYAYNWMPMVRRREEFQLFGDREFDENFDHTAAIEQKGDEYFNYVDALTRAKDQEHFDFIVQSIDDYRGVKDTLSRGGILPQMIGYTVDPTAALLFIPGFNLGVGANIGKSALRMGFSGLAFASTTEALRAPLDDAPDPYEAQLNLLASTVLGGAIGGGIKGAPYLMPFARSSANKVARMNRGEKISKTFADDGTVKLDDGTQAGVKIGDDEFDLEVNDFISSPAKRALGNPQLPKEVKSFFTRLSYNMSLPLRGQRGKATPQSVSSRKVTHMGAAHQYETAMRNLHAQELGKGERAKKFMGLFLSDRRDFDSWYSSTIRRLIDSKSPDPSISLRAKENLTDAQKKAWTVHTDFMNKYDLDARYVGLLQDDATLTKSITEMQVRLKEKQKILDDLEDSRKERLSLTKKQQKLHDKITKEIDSLGDEIETLKTVLATPTRKNFVFPIYYDKIGLQDPVKRENLTQAFARKYESERLRNPDMEDTGRSAREDAERTVARIMEEDFTDFEEGFSNMPKSKHLSHRKTGVDEWEVADHMNINMEAIFSYADRMGSRIEFARAFDGKTIEDVLKEIEVKTREAKPKGTRSDKWERDVVGPTRADFAAEFDRVMGAAQRNPDRLDNKTAFLLKNYSGWVYLPMAGVSAVTDVGSVILAHGFRDTFRAAMSMITDSHFSHLVGEQARMGGELLDMNRNLMMRRLIGDSLKRQQPTASERFVEMGNKFFYTANGLGPITVFTKNLDQILVNDKIIKLARKRVANQIEPHDNAFLNKYGIDDDMARYIVDQPTSKHSSMDFEFANIDEWARTTPADRDRIRTYQTATSAHANNTVVYGQQFDKPLIVDGIAYMRQNSFHRANPDMFPIDERMSTDSIKYVRVESGLMTLPFTFMNFAFGANNKILGAIRDPNRQYRLQGAAALIGLSYMSLQLKKPDWWFEKKDSPELLMRVVDHSGLLGMYSDIAYMGMAVAAGTGMYNPQDSMFKPKYNPDGIDAITEPLGAPIGLLTEYGRAMYDYFNGDVTEANERLFYNAPFIGLPMIKADMQELMLDRSRARF